MKLLTTFSILLLVGITAAAPAENGGDDKFFAIQYFYPEDFVNYTSTHDIVSILVPIKSLNFEENENTEVMVQEVVDETIFFVEADVADDGKRTYQGLYVYENGKATKLLDNGRDAAASMALNGSKQVFFGAQDGLYEYNSQKNEAVKYGSVTDSIIGIAKTKESDGIYILTEDHELYKVTDAGNKKTKVDEVVNAQEIVLDYFDNIYFYARDKQPYVLTANGLKRIGGLPTNPAKVNLIKPRYVFDDSALFVADNVVYLIHANASTESSGFLINPNATVQHMYFKIF